jgi:hypothetical protein
MVSIIAFVSRNEVSLVEFWEENSMGIVEETLKVLDRIPIWKRLSELPAEVDELKKRTAELETKLNGKWPGDVCRYCGARSARLSSPPRGNQEHWLCGECGKTDYRIAKS